MGSILRFLERLYACALLNGQHNQTRKVTRGGWVVRLSTKAWVHLRMQDRGKASFSDSWFILVRDAAIRQSHDTFWQEARPQSEVKLA